MATYDPIIKDSLRLINESVKEEDKESSLEPILIALYVKGFWDGRNEAEFTSKMREENELWKPVIKV